MSNPSYVTLQLAASSATAVCASQTPGGAGNLTINGASASGGVATLDVARRIVVASGGSDAAKVFTIYGTDRNGNVQSTTVTGVTSTNSVYTNLDFLTVTRVAVSAGTAGAITVGTNGVASSEWVLDNFLAPFWALAGGITGPTGTQYSLEVTYDDPNAGPNSGTVGIEQYSMGAGSISPAKAWACPQVVSASGDTHFAINTSTLPAMCMAHRLTILSGTGAVTMQSIAAGIGST